MTAEPTTDQAAAEWLEILAAPWQIHHAEPPLRVPEGVRSPDDIRYAVRVVGHRDLVANTGTGRLGKAAAELLVAEHNELITLRRRCELLEAVAGAPCETCRLDWCPDGCEHDCHARAADATLKLARVDVDPAHADQEPPMAVTPARDPWAENAALRARVGELEEELSRNRRAMDGMESVCRKADRRVAELEDVALDLNTSLGRSDRERDTALGALRLLHGASVGHVSACGAASSAHAEPVAQTRQELEAATSAASEVLGAYPTVRETQTGAVTVRRRTPEDQQLYYVRKTAELIGAKAEAEREREQARARVAALQASYRELELTAGGRLDAAAQAVGELQAALTALTDAAEPFLAGPGGTPTDVSSGQAMAAESTLAVAWRAARAVLGHRGDPGPYVAALADDLGLLVGAVTHTSSWYDHASGRANVSSFADRPSDELIAAVGRVTALLQPPDADQPAPEPGEVTVSGSAPSNEGANQEGGPR